MAKVIIDTSIWIEAFRPRCPLTIANMVRGLILDNRVLLPGIIKAELLRGAKNRAEFNHLETMLGGLIALPTPESFWDDLADFSFSLFRKGLTIPLVDTAIALHTIQNNATLLHRDRHFDLIAGASDLKSVTLPGR